jgi:hypothetical protein
MNRSVNWFAWRSCHPCVFAAALALLNSTSASAAGTEVFRGLTNGIEAVWFANTSGVSATSWTSEGTTSFARISYNKTGDYGLNYRLTDRSRESIYIKFWCRQNGGTAHGPKHLKIFSQGSPTYYSNTTFGLAGYDNEYDVYYGDLISADNDATVEWRFTGVQWGGSVLTRAAPTVVTRTSTPPVIDNNWHEWGYYVRFNDDDTQNGEIIVMYDRAEIFHLKNVYNRANGAAPIDNFGIGQFFQPPGGSYVMTRDYRDVRVAFDDWPQSTDINGTYITTPKAPTLTVQ